MECASCGGRWSPMLREGGKLPRGGVDLPALRPETPLEATSNIGWHSGGQGRPPFFICTVGDRSLRRPNLLSHTYPRNAPGSKTRRVRAVGPVCGRIARAAPFAALQTRQVSLPRGEERVGWG
jgi:hypothetical protein